MWVVMKRNKYAMRQPIAQYSFHKIFSNYLYKNISYKPTYSLSPHKLLLLPVLVTPCPHILHSSETTWNPSEPVQVLEYGAAHLQVIWIFGCLRKKLIICIVSMVYNIKVHGRMHYSRSSAV